jgi:hypothetical protein
MRRKLSYTEGCLGSGSKIEAKIKYYYYDGLLKGWKGGRKVILKVFDKISNGHYVFDEETTEKVSEILSRLRIDHRILPYRRKSNYLRHFH